MHVSLIVLLRLTNCLIARCFRTAGCEKTSKNHTRRLAGIDYDVCIGGPSSDWVCTEVHAVVMKNIVAAYSDRLKQ